MQDIEGKRKIEMEGGMGEWGDGGMGRKEGEMEGGRDG